MIYTSALTAHQLEFESGLLKNAITPSADYGSVVYKHEEYRVGMFTAPTSKGLIAAYTSENSPWLLDVGQREKSLAQGAVVGNGAYLPWSNSFTFKEPIGIRTGYNARYIGVNAAYYQRDSQNVAFPELTITPTNWLSMSGGAVEESMGVGTAFPIFSLNVGKRGAWDGFHAALTAVGKENQFFYAAYKGNASVRLLAFHSESPGALASGIYAQNRGVAAQFFSTHWFAQFFQTQSQFGMLRYTGEYLTAIYTKEEKSSLVGVSLRHNPTGFHARAGATFGIDGSLQSLAGLGYADIIFVGGGSYTLYSKQSLEPIIFPAEWYSSVLLQSTSMRIQDHGIKMMALVNSEVVQGFVAVTHSTDAYDRDQFNFFMRVAGRVVF
ncbi:MAG TPA: hypothetical protein PLY93_03420 [Turneriella sp.]|nr:hypothetical protein [Turneriella sp.]